MSKVASSFISVKWSFCPRTVSSERKWQSSSDGKSIGIGCLSTKQGESCARSRAGRSFYLNKIPNNEQKVKKLFVTCGRKLTRVKERMANNIFEFYPLVDILFK